MFGQKPFIERFEQARGGRTASGFGVDPFSLPQPPMPSEVPASPATVMLEPAAGDQPTEAEAMEAISARLIPIAANDESAKPLLFAWLDLRTKLEERFNASKDERRRTIEARIVELTTAGRERLDRIKVLKQEHGEALAQYNASEEIAAGLRVSLQSALDMNPDGKSMDDGWATADERAEWKRRVDEARSALDGRNAATRLVLERINETAGKMNSENTELLKIREQRRLLRLELQDGTPRIAGSGLQGRTGHSALP